MFPTKKVMKKIGNHGDRQLFTLETIDSKYKNKYYGDYLPINILVSAEKFKNTPNILVQSRLNLSLHYREMPSGSKEY